MKKKQNSKPKKADVEKKRIKLKSVKIPDKPHITKADFIEKLKPFDVQTREDKLGNVGIKINDTTITYVNQTRVGVKLHTKKRDSKGRLQWFPFADVYESKQLDEIVSLISDFDKTNDMNVLVKLGFLHPNEVNTNAGNNN